MGQNILVLLYLQAMYTLRNSWKVIYFILWLLTFDLLYKTTAKLLFLVYDCNPLPWTSLEGKVIMEELEKKG